MVCTSRYGPHVLAANNQWEHMPRDTAMTRPQRHWDLRIAIQRKTSYCSRFWDLSSTLYLPMIAGAEVVL